MPGTVEAPERCWSEATVPALRGLIPSKHAGQCQDGRDAFQESPEGGCLSQDQGLERWR